MTDEITLEDIGLSEVLYDPRNNTEWHLTDLRVELDVRIVHPDGDRTPSDVPPSSYPLETVLSKLEHGDLERDPPTSDEEELADAAEETREADSDDLHELDDALEVDEFECETCGDTFETQQGLNGHQSAHSE